MSESKLVGAYDLISLQDIADGLTVDVSLASYEDSGNTQTITSSDASPGSPWVGSWSATDSNGVVEVISTLIASLSTLGGIFTFQFSPDGGTTITVSEAITINSFSQIRDFPLQNFGTHYRTKFEPDVALGAETVTLTTRFMRQAGNRFARNAVQELETEAAFLPQTYAFLKGFGPDNVSRNFVAPGVDAGNSTTTPLAGAATFTGDWQEVEGYIGIDITVNADQVSATNGLVLEFADDDSGTNSRDAWPVGKTYSTSNVGEAVTFTARATLGQYARISYTNGPFAQASFNLVFSLTATANEPLPSMPMKAVEDWSAGQFDVSALAPVEIATPAIARRKEIVLRNHSTDDPIYLRHESSLTISNGYELGAQEVIVLPLGPRARIWALSGATAGASAQADRDGTTTATTGSPSNPDNALDSDADEATLDATGEIIEITGFTAAGTHANIDQIILSVLCGKSSSGGTDPQLTISYELSGTPTGSDTTVTLTSATNSVQTLDVTGDQSWSPSDISNVGLILTAASVSNRDIEIQHAYLDVTEVAGSTSRISLMQLSDDAENT